MEWAWVILIPLFTTYAIRILSYLHGWNICIRYQGDDQTEVQRKVSIIIPVRNEARHIAALLEDLSRQQYPEEHFELIVVDDHSTDQTKEIVSSQVSRSANFRLIELGAGEFGKKNAIKNGVLYAKHDVIISTDGDCRATADWLAHMMAGFGKKGIRMVAGPLMLEPDTGWFRAMQSLEHLSLIGVGAGSVGLNSPIMCNAANLAYLKEDFLRFLKAGKQRSESGDDIFFLLWLKKAQPGAIRYLTSPGAAIRTLPAENLRSLVMQRFRWASKSRLYRDFHIFTTSILVFLTNVSLILTGILCFVSFSWIMPFGLLFLVKCIIDLVFLERVLKHFGKRRLLRVFLPLELIYFMYVSFVGIASQFIPYTWKERNIQP